MQKPNPIIARGLKYAQWGGYLFSFLLLILAFLQWKELSVDASLYAYFKTRLFFCARLDPTPARRQAQFADLEAFFCRYGLALYWFCFPHDCRCDVCLYGGSGTGRAPRRPRL